ncbi:hypothetical protein JOD54_001888 [Actinokineospora baliensis]|uniref:pentapeptide repeat-containing protein n=1 Tax=Actinokineospora baliensis TaxID=547056 RepID=UPI001957A801|nr:pentapeptide repeat-containing protein [Actinokineospora baliensis]MBM7771684.1 hypothetical protein [Actinokineospora baliensis]
MRSLLGLAAIACTGVPATADCALVAVDPVTALVIDPREHVAAELAALRSGTSAAELSTAGHGLHVLLFARGDGAVWVVDGWRLLREADTEVDLSYADLRGARLPGARLAGADLRETDLRGADLVAADLSGADLSGADLSGADLRRASLLGADLTEADLRRTALVHADLQRTTCVRTALRGADLADSYFWDVDVSHTFLDGVELDRASDLEGKRVTTATAKAAPQPRTTGVS